MERSLMIIAIAIVYLGLAGCDSSLRETTVTRTMRAGPGEPTFAEAYEPLLQLPMSSVEFMELLKKRGLQYTVLSGPKLVSAMPLPSADSGVDQSSLAQCIQVYGKRNDAERSMQIFRAYVNKQAQVFYIENAFAYTGP